MNSRWIAVGLGMIVSVASLWLISATFDVGESVEVLAGAAPIPILLILGVVTVQIAIRARRWTELLPAMVGSGRISAARLVPPLLIGYLGNAVLPARLGEPIRAVVASRRERIPLAESFASVLLERIIDIATLALVALVAAIVVQAPNTVVSVLGLIAAGGMFVLALLVTNGPRRLLQLMDRAGRGRWSLAQGAVKRFVAALGGTGRRRPIAIAAAISIAAWMMDAGSFWLAGQSVGAEISYPGAMLVASVTVLGTAVPSAPGYVGTFEIAAAGMAGLLGVPAPAALALAVVAHAATLIPTAVGGLVALLASGANLVALAASAKTVARPMATEMGRSDD